MFANQLDQDQFEHFAVDLLSHFGCRFTPLSASTFLLDSTQLVLDGFDDFKNSILSCSFDAQACSDNNQWQYIDQQHELYLATIKTLLSSQAGNASFFLDDNLPARSAVLETVFTDSLGKSSSFALDARMNILTQYKANEQAVYRSKNSTIDLKPYKRSLEAIFPSMLETVMQQAASHSAGKLQALRVVAGAEFALFGKNKR